MTIIIDPLTGRVTGMGRDICGMCKGGWNVPPKEGCRSDQHRIAHLEHKLGLRVTRIIRLRAALQAILDDGDAVHASDTGMGEYNCEGCETKMDLAREALR